MSTRGDRTGSSKRAAAAGAGSGDGDAAELTAAAVARAAEEAKREGDDNGGEQAIADAPPATDAGEAGTRAMLLMLQKRIAELETASAKQTAEMAVHKAQQAERQEAEAVALQHEASVALEEAAVEEEVRVAAVIQLEQEAQEVRRRPGEAHSEMEIQQELARRMVERHKKEREAAAVAVAAVARVREMRESPQGQQAIAARSLLQPSPAPGSPPVVQRGVKMSVHGGALGYGLSAAALGTYKALKPQQLVATEAAKGATLEDWIYSVEQMLRVAECGDFKAQMELVALCWDRQVNTWWTGAAEMAKARGEEITDWYGFLVAVRANYTPVSDEYTACSMMFTLKMGGRESMDQYVGRAHELYNRISRGRVNSEMSAEFLERGVDGRRFPLTLREVGMKQQRSRAKENKGVGFDTMRSLLVEAAAIEPMNTGAGGQSSAASSSSHQGGKQRVNNITTAGGRYPQPEEEEEGEEVGEQRRSVNAVEQAGMKCYRCQQMGHIARDCSLPETRKCNRCKKTGHLVRNCRVPATGGAQSEAKSTN